MKRLIALFLLLACLCHAGDYSAFRDYNHTMPGGATNQLVWTLGNSNISGAEITELQAWGGATSDTATFYRVSGCGCVTNTLGTLSLPGPSSCMVTNFNMITQTPATTNGIDRVLVVATGTNTFKWAVVGKSHFTGMNY